MPLVQVPSKYIEGLGEKCARGQYSLKEVPSALSLFIKGIICPGPVIQTSLSTFSSLVNRVVS